MQRVRLLDAHNTDTYTRVHVQEYMHQGKEEWNTVDENDDERSEYDADFSMSEVTDVLQSMAFSKAGGPDGVAMQVL